MNPNLDILKRVEAAIEFEKKRHRLNLNILTKVAEMMKSVTEDAGALSDVAVEILAGQARAATDGSSRGPENPGVDGRIGGPAKSGLRRKIVTVDAAPKGRQGPTAGMTAAIREAITYFGHEPFTTGEILGHVRQHHSHLETDSGTISKRLYQLRNAGVIELVPGAKPGKQGSRPYRLKAT